jgi:hypothetical protein
VNVENPSNSKFQLVTETLIPHKCVACNVSADGRMQFVDFGLSLDVEDPLYIGVPNEALGVIYICENCAKEIASLIGAMPASVTEQFTQSFEAQEANITRLELEIERLRTLNESYVTVFTSLGLSASKSQDDATEPEQSSEGPARAKNIFTDASN